MRVHLGFPVGLELVLEEDKNLLAPARGILKKTWGGKNGQEHAIIARLSRLPVGLEKKNPPPPPPASTC